MPTTAAPRMARSTQTHVGVPPLAASVELVVVGVVAVGVTVVVVSTVVPGAVVVSRTVVVAVVGCVTVCVVV